MSSWGRYAADALLLDVLDSGQVSGATIAANPFTVPAGQRWVVLNLILRWQASATVGTRTVAYQFRDASDVVIYQAQSVLTLTASQHINFLFNDYLARDAAAFGNTGGLLSIIQTFHSPFALEAGEDIRFFENTATDGAGDVARGLAVIQRLSPA